MNQVQAIRLSGKHRHIVGQLVADFFTEPCPSSARLSELLEDERSIVLAAIQNKSAVGYLVAYRFPSLTGVRLVYLYDIEVHPEFQRSGIGTCMVELLKGICLADGVESIWVGSSITNVAACSLWSRTGAHREDEQFVEFTFELAK